MACPRLPVCDIVVTPAVVCEVTMAFFRSRNGIPRFWETCSAAMNCPEFLKPIDAVSSVIGLPVFGSVTDDNIVETLPESPWFVLIFAAMGFSFGVVVVVVVPPDVAPVVVPPDVVPPAVVVVPDVVDVVPVVFVVFPELGEGVGLPVVVCGLPCVCAAGCVVGGFAAASDAAAVRPSV